MILKKNQTKKRNRLRINCINSLEILKVKRIIDLIKTAAVSEEKDLLDMIKDLDISFEIWMRHKWPSSRLVCGVFISS